MALQGLHHISFASKQLRGEISEHKKHKKQVLTILGIEKLGIGARFRPVIYSPQSQPKPLATLAANLPLVGWHREKMFDSE